MHKESQTKKSVPEKLSNSLQILFVYKFFSKDKKYIKSKLYSCGLLSSNPRSHDDGRHNDGLHILSGEKNVGEVSRLKVHFQGLWRPMWPTRSIKRFI
jgi:hypothetical protein